MVEIALLTVFPAAVAFAGAMDLFTMTIPNRVSLALVAGFVVMAPTTGMAPGVMLWHAAAGLVVLTIGIALFIPGWIGGGDAKLAAAVALWLGFDNLLAYLFCVALAGGTLATVFMRARAHPLPAVLFTQSWAVRLHDRQTGLPYGLPLAAGALLLYPHTQWFTVWLV